ncbi:glutaredoxin [Nannocystis pusilla]|uniref:glutaredoxin n=1 Tax=Nannocystis pusilla TaxID=889268 RepID=UPI003DA3BA72
MSRPLLPESSLAPHVREQIQSFHRNVVDAVTAAIARDPVVVVGMAQNPFVKKARRALEAAGVPFTYLEYGSYLSQWKERLAIKLWSGFPTFPQVFVRGTLIGGFTDVRAHARRRQLAAAARLALTRTSSVVTAPLGAAAHADHGAVGPRSVATSPSGIAHG